MKTCFFDFIEKYVFLCYYIAIIMQTSLKHFFIPHEGNNYHPYILHSKRAVFYSLFFLSLKALVFLFALLLPSVVFVMPDVLESEENKLLTLTNNLRIQKGLPTLSPVIPLHVSADNKSKEMQDLQYFSHNSPNGYDLSHFLSEAGYQYQMAGENLAMGFSSAEEIFSAWMQSPTHYANLIDPDFKEFGLAMESGQYNDLATVYVTAHFAEPKVVTPKSFPNLSLSNTSNIPGPIFTVEPIVQQAELVSEKSFVDWKEENNKTLFSATVVTRGDVQSATVFVGGHSFPLKEKEPGLYEGTLLLSGSADTFFKPVVEPSLTLVGKDALVSHNFLQWKKIKIISPTPLEKYMRARNLLGIPSEVFDFSRMVYIFFIVLFSFSLILSIFIPIRRQHPHIISQTLGLIVLLSTLFLI